MSTQHVTADSNALTPIDTSTEETCKTAWQGIKAGLGIIGRNIAKFVRATGSTAKQAAKTADGDVRAQLVELPFFALTQLIPRDNAQRLLQPYVPGEGAQGRPVILVHGMAGSAGNFEVIRRLLAIRGRKNIYRFDYREHPSVQQAVPAFERYLKALLSQIPEDVNIDIIGHSLGGLVTRATLHNDNLRSRVHHLVTLGSPHRGSHLARLGGFELSEELRPDSNFIASLNTTEHREKERNELRITAYWTPRDVFVLPSESAKLDGARNIRMDDATHISWLIRPTQAHEVLEALDTPAG